MRGQFLQLKAQEFVTAARAVGASPARLMARHLFPNALAIIIVEATLWLSYAILLEASLSYLGPGVQIPMPSWGNMLQDGQRELLYSAWWLTIFPGMAIFITVLALNLMGDGLRDALAPGTSSTRSRQNSQSLARRRKKARSKKSASLRPSMIESLPVERDGTTRGENR